MNFWKELALEVFLIIFLVSWQLQVRGRLSAGFLYGLEEISGKNIDLWSNRKFNIVADLAIC